MPDNKVVSHEQWLKARLELLAAEKKFTRQRDALTRRRMAMPWERVEKSYQFEGSNGALSLADLFDGRSQLIVYHADTAVPAQYPRHRRDRRAKERHSTPRTGTTFPRAPRASPFGGASAHHVGA